MSQFFKFLFASCLGTFLALILLFLFVLFLGAGKLASQMQEAAGRTPFLGQNFAQEFVREMLKAISLGAGFYLSFAAAIAALCVFVVMGAFTYNRTVYPPLIARWRRSFLCRRCGDRRDRGWHG